MLSIIHKLTIPLQTRIRNSSTLLVSVYLYTYTYTVLLYKVYIKCPLIQNCVIALTKGLERFAKSLLKNLGALFAWGCHCNQF